MQELTGGGVDYSFEAIGLKADGRAGVRRCCGTAAPRTVIGMIPVGQTVEIHGFELPVREEAPGLEHGLEPLPRRHAALRRPVPRTGRLKLDELVSRRIRLDEINDGFDAMKAGEVARSVIMFD